MKHVIVIGDNSSKNLGDPIVTQSAKWVIENLVVEPDSKVDMFDIAGRNLVGKTTAPSQVSSLSLVQSPSVIKAKLIGIVEDFKTLIKWLLIDRKRFLARLENMAIFYVSNSVSLTYIFGGGR